MSVSLRPLTVAGAGLALVLSSTAVPARSVTSPDPSRAERWGPVKTLARQAQAASIAVDSGGTTTVVWATSVQPTAIVVKQRPAGGPWGKRIVLGRGRDPHVVADRRGNVTVVWVTQRRDFSDGVAAARRPAGGTWTKPVRLTHDVSNPGHVPGDSLGFGASEPDVAVSHRGAVAVSWAWGSDESDVPWRVQFASRPPAGPWRAAVDVTPPSGARQPEVGIAANGTAVVVYGRQPFGEPQALLARRRPVGGPWSKPSLVTREGYSHDLAVDRAGNAAAVFTPDSSTVRGVVKPVGRRWQAARKLSGPGGEVNDFALAMTASGEAMVAMGRADGRVDVVERPSGGPWSGRVRLSAPRVPSSRVVCALGSSGDAFVGWGTYGLYGKYRPDGGTWSKRFTISPDAGVEVLESVDAAVGRNGDVAVVWDQEARPLKVRLMTAG
jgi:hypothetical protein